MGNIISSCINESCTRDLNRDAEFSSFLKDDNNSFPEIEKSLTLQSIQTNVKTEETDDTPGLKHCEDTVRDFPTLLADQLRESSPNPEYDNFESDSEQSILTEFSPRSPLSPLALSMRRLLLIIDCMKLFDCR
jgi:hypothetical protein